VAKNERRERSCRTHPLERHDRVRLGLLDAVGVSLHGGVSAGVVLPLWCGRDGGLVRVLL